MKHTSIVSVALFALFMVLPAFSAERLDALKLYSSGQYIDAIAVCEQELRDNPRNLDSYTVLCWSLIRNRQYAEAEQRATQARNINPYDQRFIESLAETKYFLGKNSEALALFQEYVAMVPDTAISRSRVDSAYYFMGEIYIRQVRYQHADIAFSTAVRIDPKVEMWWIRLGYARELAGNYRGSVAAYDRALQLNPSSSDAQRGKDRALSQIR